MLLDRTEMTTALEAERSNEALDLGTNTRRQ